MDIWDFISKLNNAEVSINSNQGCSQNASQNQVLPNKQAIFSQHAIDSLNSSTIWLEKAIFE
ncbi:18541_t:CDS:1, partial [Gigaspora rosea]